MKQIKIEYNAEPDCLKELRDNQYSYEDLKDDCIKLVRQILNSSQFGLCAYCERRLTSTTFIEHYNSREHHPEEQLKFNNFIAVCSGKTYLCKKTGKHLEHCDTSKGEQAIQIDPRQKEHIDTIYYESDASIKSSNSGFDHDLNDILKLNLGLLKKKREDEFNRNFKNLRAVAIKLNLDKQNAIELGIRKLNENLTEYSGYLHFRYSKILDGNKPI